MAELAHIAKAMVPDARPVTLTHADKTAEGARNKRREVNAANWREQAQEARQRPLKTQNGVRLAEKFGTTIDPKTGAKDRQGTELTRHTTVNGAKKDIETLYASKYEGLTDPQKSLLRAMVIKEAMQRPHLAAELSTIKNDPTKMKAWAERMLTEDPKFMAEVGRRYDMLTDPDREPPVLVDAVSSVQQKVNELQIERDAKETEFKDVDSRFKKVEQGIKEYDRPGGAAVPGSKAELLEQLTNAYPKLTTDAENFTSIVEEAKLNSRSLSAELKRMQDSGLTSIGGRTETEIRTDFNTQQTSLKNASNELAKCKAQILQKEQLDKDQIRLTQQDQMLRQEKLQKETDLKKAENDLSYEKGKLVAAENIQAGQEQDIIDGFKSIVKDSINEVFNAQEDELGQAVDEELAESAAKGTPDEEALYKGMLKAWRKPMTTGKWFWKKERRVFDRKLVGDSFNNLMANGPKEVMTNVLKNMENPATKANYTADEINGLFSNPEFVAKMQSDVVRTLLRGRILTGGLTHEDIDLIVDAPWGSGMIEKALNTNEEFHRAVAGVYGEGALKQHGFMDRLRTDVKNNPNLLMLLLIGFIPGIVRAATSEPQNELPLVA